MGSRTCQGVWYEWHCLRYGYDSLSRLATVETYERNNVAVDVDTVTAGNQPQTAAYAYSLNGSLDYQTNPDGSVTDFTYDDLNRLTDIDEYKKDPNESTPAVFTDNRAQATGPSKMA